MLLSLEKKLHLFGPQFSPLSSEEYMLGLISNNYGMLLIWQSLRYELSMLFIYPSL